LVTHWPLPSSVPISKNMDNFYTENITKDPSHDFSPPTLRGFQTLWYTNTNRHDTTTLKCIIISKNGIITTYVGAMYPTGIKHQTCIQSIISSFTWFQISSHHNSQL
jgi:hypothetical protein